MENLAQYLNDGVEFIARQALKASLKNPLESAFILRYMAAQQRSSKKRMQAEEEGLHIPSFLIASISSQCNLFCAGCYARANHSCGEAPCAEQLSDGEWARIFREASDIGISFVLLAGGEPFLRRNVIEAAAAYPGIVFPVFTNGTMFDMRYIELFHKNRNLVPILSLEGSASQTDARRGPGVYEKLEEAMARLKGRGILFGASVTVTKENLLSVTDKAFVGRLESFGCKVVIYVEYVPVSDQPGQTAPDPDDRQKLLARQDTLRASFDSMVLVAFPGDEESLGGCLAAGRGFFHINPMGGAEPCPFSPFSDTSLKTCSLKDALRSPLFYRLKSGGYMQGEHLGGCTLFGKEEEIRRLACAP